MILWNYVIVWILAGCITAGILAFGFNDVWTKKKISGNLLVGMILVIVFGWIGLAVMIMLLVIASLVWWFENHGSNAAISWGKDED